MSRDMQDVLEETIKLQAQRRMIDEKLERNKDLIRKAACGQARNFAINGIGQITVAAKRVEGLRANPAAIDKVGIEDLRRLVERGVIGFTVRKAKFDFLTRAEQDKFLSDGLIELYRDDEGVSKPAVTIRAVASNSSRTEVNPNDYSQSGRPVPLSA